MRRQQDTIGHRGPWLSLLGVSALALLAGCGWFGSDTPVGAGARAGVDRKAPASNALPPATGQQHDSGIVASDPVGTPQIGSIVPGKGGQKAQKEAADKEASERDAKEREERDKRDAEERDAKAKEQQAEPEKKPPSTAPAGIVPPKPAAAERGGGSAGPSTFGSPPAATAPAPAPVTSAPGAPPPQPAPATDQPAASPRT
jgi:hypothetical protein